MIYNKLKGIKVPLINWYIFGWLPDLDYIGCIGFPGGFGEENTTFFPGCESHRARRESSCKDGSNNCIKRTDTDTLFDSIQRSLGLDHKVVKLDFSKIGLTVAYICHYGTGERERRSRSYSD